MSAELLLPTLLERHAAERPDEVFVEHVDGPSVTFGALRAQVLGWMGALRGAGVTAGDRVAVLLPPGGDCIAVWAAAARLGAVEVPLNTAYRGRFLATVLADAGPRCIVVHHELVDRLPRTDDVPFLVVGAPEGSVTLAPEAAGESEWPRPGDIASVLYTSGTSGRSKGVLVTWAQQLETARWTVPIEGRGREDVWYGPWPMFHVSGKLGVYNAALTGGRLVVRNQFSASAFWSDVRRYGATSTMLVASTVAFLASQPASPEDRAHTLRNVFAAPMPADAAGFAERFGVRVCTVFNMTETASPIASGWDPDLPKGACGRPRPGAHCRVVDEHGEEVPVGEVGELVVRMDGPHEIMAGYLNAPEATLEAWRDLWFHTGDAVRRDEAGYFYFVDRMKDTIRRRGENISSLEVEIEANAHPSVQESAVVGVPTPFGDQDVRLFVVPKAGESFDPEALADHLAEQLPDFMVPTSIVTLAEIPKTHTHRPRKHELRDLPVGEDVWVRPARSRSRSGDGRVSA